MKKKIIGIIICMMLIATVLPVAGELLKSKTKNVMENFNIILDEYPLPPPLSVDMVLEESICRRMSVRSFTGEAVTDEELSTILWAAYGYTANDNRSIYNPDGTYSTIIYVIRSDATYKYVPENHSLSLFKSGNYLHLGQYTPPIMTNSTLTQESFLIKPFSPIKRFVSTAQWRRPPSSWLVVVLSRIGYLGQG